MTLAFIDLNRQYRLLKDEIQAGLSQVMEKAQFINGPQVGEFEKALADYVGVSQAVACANGTDAMVMPLMALGLEPGDAVFCPAFTFIATAEAPALRGAHPVFADVDPVTYNLDPADLEAKILKVKNEGRLRPRVIIPVDLFGLPADYRALEPLAEKYGLIILEDAAQGFGGRLDGRRAGSFGLAAGTSFFPAKPLGCYGDGGAVLTNDRELAETIRSIRDHGAGGHKYEHLRLGTNSRLDTMQAVILISKLKIFPRELEERQRVAERYIAKLKDHLPVPVVAEGFLSSWAQFTVRVPAGRRELISARLKDGGIPTAVYYPQALHLQPAFAHLGGRPGDLPVCEKAAGEVLSLPMHPYLTNEEVDLIAENVITALG